MHISKRFVDLEVKRNSALDGTRGFGCLIILMYHLFHMSFIHRFEPDAVTNFLINLGFPMMSLFFMVSSFTIFSLFQKRVKNEKYPLRFFYLRRVLRIFPLWWLLIGIYVVTGNHGIKEVLSHMFFTFGFYIDHPGYNFTTIGWSLFIEEWFYLLFPLIYYLSRRVSILLLVFIVLLGLQQYWLNRCHIDFFPLASNFCYPLFPRHAVYLIIGILLVHLIEFSLFRKRIVHNLIDTLIIVLISLKVFGVIEIMYEFSMGLIILSAFNHKSLIRKFFELKIFVSLGRLCYPFYLVHTIIIYYLHRPLNQTLYKLDITLEFYIRFIICVVITFIVAKILNISIERYFLSLSKRLIFRLNAK